MRTMESSSFRGSSVDMEAMENMNPNGQTTKIDVTRQRFPYCVVWTPLPMITWFFPPIGHMGICNSQGVIYDFGGPYYISEGRMTFGTPTKYMRLDSSQISPEDWDSGVVAANEEYKKKMHNICCQNCHHHTGSALDHMGYGSGTWSQFRLGFDLFLFGKFTSFGAFLRTWLPFILMVVVALTIWLASTNGGEDA
eukprot:m.36437 g.36437  ORF g.36437 m.36437 type:complete len:195 (-) comp17356_c0_seq2:113-697(-)